MKPAHPIRTVFDEATLVSAAGLVAVVAGMLAGADCIRDLDRLRHGGMSRLISGGGTTLWTRPVSGVALRIRIPPGKTGRLSTQPRAEPRVWTAFGAGGGFCQPVPAARRAAGVISMWNWFSSAAQSWAARSPFAGATSCSACTR